MFRLERRRRVGGRVTTEVVYGISSLRMLREKAAMGRAVTTEVVHGISSLSPVAGPADVRLRCTRAHWGIEALHHVRDVTLGEDRCRVRRGAAPRVLASLRNVAAYLLRQLGTGTVAAAVRTVVARPELALDALHHPDSISA